VIPLFLVLTGLDVLKGSDFATLQGARVGLITNHTGRTVDGHHAADLLAKAPNVELVALFAPEHGLRGEKDETITDELDKATGKPVYSLYNLKEKGEARYRPSREQLKGIDTLVFDIQDIGARFYTYTSTMGYCMEAAAEQGIKFVVLDRPNPIGGLAVEGAVSEPSFRGHTAFHPIATRHAMTAGELAMLYKKELNLNLDLEVIWCTGWQRSMFFDETGQPWINPSPNMRTMNAAVLYPGLCLLEATNISVGRGTDLPFERIGAPWIDPLVLAAFFNGRRIPGVSAHPVSFTPESSKHAGQLCRGIQFIVTDRQAMPAVRVGFELAAILHSMFPDWEHEGFVRLVQNREAADSILEGPVDRMMPRWSLGLEDFKKRRAAVLHYP
jgi:uncharacterized protein YbbC (DUF1343 family)